MRFELELSAKQAARVSASTSEVAARRYLSECQDEAPPLIRRFPAMHRGNELDWNDRDQCGNVAVMNQQVLSR
jgi:hypothetical protein